MDLKILALSKKLEYLLLARSRINAKIDRTQKRLDRAEKMAAGQRDIFETPRMKAYEKTINSEQTE